MFNKSQWTYGYEIEWEGESTGEGYKQQTKYDKDQVFFNEWSNKIKLFFFLHSFCKHVLHFHP